MTCDRLDDYLDGTMAADDQQAFRLHLAECSACREEMRFQETVDRLLRQATACETPPGLLKQLNGSIQTSARWRSAVIAALASAASLLLAIVFRQTSEPPGTAPNTEIVQQVPNAVPPFAVPEKPSVALVVMDSSSDLLAVPQESRHSNVTIYWLYPTIKPQASVGDMPEDATTPGSET
jgi:anti-sigma factor RsiW